MTNTGSAKLLSPVAHVAICLPFWMRAAETPVKSDKRSIFFKTMADHLDSMNEGDGVANWQLDPSFFADAEPIRLVPRLRARLIGHLDPPDDFLKKVRSIWASNKLESKLIISTLASSFRYDELGLGTVEYLLKITPNAGVEEDEFQNVMHKAATWRALSLTDSVMAGSFPIQRRWSVLRENFKEAIQVAAAKHRTSGRSLALETFRGENWKDREGLKRDDDLLWTFSFNIVLFRSNGNILLDEERELLHSHVAKVAAACDGIDSDRSKTGHYGRVISPGLNIDGGSLATLYSGAVMVGLVFDDNTTAALPNQPRRVATPSIRLRSLWRTMHLHYGALTTASDGLHDFIGRAATVRGAAAVLLHSTLRETVAALSMIRLRCRRDLYTGYDLETLTYGSAHDAWDLDATDVTLGLALEGAVRVTTGVNETVTQNQERWLNNIVLSLSIITLISAAQDLSQFVGNPSLDNAIFNIDSWARLLFLAGLLALLIFLIGWNAYGLIRARK